MNKSLLDTDIFSEFLKTRNLNVQRHAVAYRRAHGRFTLSVVTVMEMVRGLHKAHRSLARITYPIHCLGRIE
jgi:tRNA(fMet)-specific endonuclease VapC